MRLVRHEGYYAALPQLVEDGNGRRLEPYEVEAAARALAKRGFVRVQRGASGGRRRDSMAARTSSGDGFGWLY